MAIKRITLGSLLRVHDDLVCIVEFSPTPEGRHKLVGGDWVIVTQGYDEQYYIKVLCKFGHGDVSYDFAKSLVVP